MPNLRNLPDLGNLPDLRNLRTWLNQLKNKLAATDGPGIDVIRHRMRSHRRRLQLVAVAAAVAVAGGAVTATAAGPDGSPGHVAAETALADRAAAADRADRSQRDDGDQKDQRSGAKDGSGKADQAQDKSEKQKQKKKQKEEKKQKKRKKKKKSKNWVHPMPGARTTSCYGARWGTMHAGVDLAAAAGTPIRAVGAGRVLGAGWLYPGYGISVVIKHRNGFLTHYAHASKALVSAGQRVKPGQKIAREGSTGDSTGPHLHLEVHRGMWNQIEPTKWLARHGLKIPGC